MYFTPVSAIYTRFSELTVVVVGTFTNFEIKSVTFDRSISSNSELIHCLLHKCVGYRAVSHPPSSENQSLQISYLDGARSGRTVSNLL